MRVKSVEREFNAAKLAVDHLLVEVAAGGFHFPPEVEWRDVDNASKHIERTYVVRLFSCFESVLKEYFHLRGSFVPRRNASGLIKVASKDCPISDQLLKSVHEVRRYRNSIVHGSDYPPGPITLSDSRRRVNRFIDKLR